MFLLLGVFRLSQSIFLRLKSPRITKLSFVVLTTSETNFIRLLLLFSFVFGLLYMANHSAYEANINA